MKYLFLATAIVLQVAGLVTYLSCPNVNTDRTVL
jgi:hypothetical protein